MGREALPLKSFRHKKAQKIFLGFCALCALLWLSQPAVRSLPVVSRDDSTLVSTTTLEGRLAVFDDVWETISERYYDPKFHGVDWQAKRNVFRPAAAPPGNAPG